MCAVDDIVNHNRHPVKFSRGSYYGAYNLGLHVHRSASRPDMAPITGQPLAQSRADVDILLITIAPVGGCRKWG